jgi:hypothetical protein
MRDRLDSRLASKARRGFRGHPLATIAFYGPNRDVASKVVVAIFTQDNADPAQLMRWHNHEVDVREHDGVGQEVIAFLKSHGPRTVILSDGVIGCPHEEGSDYPEGQACPQCPYWAGRDRWSGDRVH